MSPAPWKYNVLMGIIVKTERQTDRQTDKQTDREKEKDSARARGRKTEGERDRDRSRQGHKKCNIQGMTLTMTMVTSLSVCLCSCTSRALVHLTCASVPKVSYVCFLCSYVYTCARECFQRIPGRVCKRMVIRIAKVCSFNIYVYIYIFFKSLFARTARVFLFFFVNFLSL